VNWRNSAVCANDKNHSYWISYNLEKIEYAIDGCKKCTVVKECILYNSELEEVIGVVAGTTEFDRLVSKWKKVEDINDSNWQ